MYFGIFTQPPVGTHPIIATLYALPVGGFGVGPAYEVIGLIDFTSTVARPVAVTSSLEARSTSDLASPKNPPLLAAPLSVLCWVRGDDSSPLLPLLVQPATSSTVPAITPTVCEYLSIFDLCTVQHLP